MMRSALVLLLLPLSVQGFGVVSKPTFTRPAALFAVTPDDDTVIPEAGDEIPFFMAEDAEAVPKQGADFSAKFQDVFKQLSSKAQGIMTEERINEMKAKAQEIVSEERIKAFSEKAQEFANDERVKEISTKATDFAKDFASTVFTKVGDTLKDMKKDNEGSEKIENVENIEN